jgi:thioredoxin:protein disulfide reductase
MNVKILALLMLLMGAGLIAQTAPPQAKQEPAILQGATVAGVAAGYLQTDAFLKFVADAEAGVVQSSALDNRGALSLVALILLGGLALNLTPCVLPMIPINLAIIGAGSQAGSRRRGWLLGGAYGLAMALVYGVIGGIVVVTAGTFGTINSSPWFNLGIAVLFVVLGLAMFDVITIDASTLMRSGQVDPSKRGSLSLAFFMGGVAALLAGACVAPVVIQVIVLSSKLYAGGATIALGLPLLLGVGMALPWPLAGAGIAALPKPGAWMVRVKQVLGVLILATAVYYGYEAYHLFKTRYAAPAPAAANVGADGAYTTLADGLAAAKRDGKPVFLDMWATWCKNCVVMEQTTFKDPKVVKALDGYIKIKLQSEDLEQGDAKVLLDRFETFGLPTYAILQFRD